VCACVCVGVWVGVCVGGCVGVCVGVCECVCVLVKGRDSVVTIGTHYELDGPGIEYRWERDLTDCDCGDEPFGSIQCGEFLD